MTKKTLKKNVCGLELEAISSLGLKVARLESIVGEYGDARHIAGRLDELEKESSDRRQAEENNKELWGSLACVISFFGGWILLFSGLVLAFTPGFGFLEILGSIFISVIGFAFLVVSLTGVGSRRSS